MSTVVRVNLLPPEIGQRQRERRAIVVTALVVLGYVAVLGLLYVLKLGAVDAAREERDVAQAEVGQLQGEVARLAPFAELDRRLTARNGLLASAMGSQISWARQLNDLSLAFPASASLLTLDGVMAGTAEPAAAATAGGGGVDLGDGVAKLTFSGYSVERYAPGVERVLVKLGDVPSYFNSYLSQAAESERGDTEVTTFDGAVQLDEDAYTGRYADGLPPEVEQ